MKFRQKRKRRRSTSHHSKHKRQSNLKFIPNISTSLPIKLPTDSLFDKSILQKNSIIKKNVEERTRNHLDRVTQSKIVTLLSALDRNKTLKTKYTGCINENQELLHTFYARSWVDEKDNDYGCIFDKCTEMRESRPKSNFLVPSKIISKVSKQKVKIDSLRFFLIKEKRKNEDSSSVLSQLTKIDHFQKSIQAEAQPFKPDSGLLKFEQRRRLSSSAFASDLPLSIKSNKSSSSSNSISEHKLLKQSTLKLPNSNLQRFRGGDSSIKKIVYEENFSEIKNYHHDKPAIPHYSRSISNEQDGTQRNSEDVGKGSSRVKLPSNSTVKSKSLLNAKVEIPQNEGLVSRMKRLKQEARIRRVMEIQKITNWMKPKDEEAPKIVKKNKRFKQRKKRNNHKQDFSVALLFLNQQILEMQIKYKYYVDYCHKIQYQNKIGLSEASKFARFRVYIPKSASCEAITNAFKKRWWWGIVETTQDLTFFQCYITKNPLQEILDQLPEGRGQSHNKNQLFPEYEKFVHLLEDQIKNGNEGPDPREGYSHLQSNNDFLIRNIKKSTAKLPAEDEINDDCDTELYKADKFEIVVHNAIADKKSHSKVQNIESSVEKLLNANSDSEFKTSISNPSTFRFNKSVTFIDIDLSLRTKKRLERCLRREVKKQSFMLHQKLFDKRVFQNIIIPQLLTDNLYTLPNNLPSSFSTIPSSTVRFSTHLYLPALPSCRETPRNEGPGGVVLYSNSVHPLSYLPSLTGILSRYSARTSLIDYSKFCPFSYVFSTSDDLSFSDFVRCHYLMKGKCERNLWVLRCYAGEEDPEHGPHPQLVRVISEVKRIKNIVIGMQIYRKVFVLQKYIETPVLWRKKRVKIKYYALATWVDGSLKVYFYQEGLGEIDKGEYVVGMLAEEDKKKGKSIRDIELAGEETYEKQIVGYDRLVAFIDSEFNKERKENIKSIVPDIELKAKVSYILTQTIIKHVFLASIDKINQQRKQFIYQLFCFDFLLEQNLSPWLIDIKDKPKMHYKNSNTANYFLGTMYDNALKYLSP